MGENLKNTIKKIQEDLKQNTKNTRKPQNTNQRGEPHHWEYASPEFPRKLMERKEPHH